MSPAGRPPTPRSAGNTHSRMARTAIRAIDVNPGPGPDRLGHRANISEREGGRHG